DDAARLQALADLIDEAARPEVEEADEVPALLAEVELVRALVGRGQFHPLPARLLLGLRDADRRDVHAGDLPALLGQVEGVAALAHADVQRRAGLALLDRVD